MRTVLTGDVISIATSTPHTYDRMRGDDSFFYVLSPSDTKGLKDEGCRLTPGDLVAARAETYDPEMLARTYARVPERFPDVVRSTRWGVATLDGMHGATVTVQARIARDRVDEAVADIRKAVETSANPLIRDSSRIVIACAPERLAHVEAVAAAIPGAVIKHAYGVRLEFPVQSLAAAPAHPRERRQGAGEVPQAAVAFGPA